MRSMCVGVAETEERASDFFWVLAVLELYLVGANIVRPRRNIKKLFFYRTFA